MIFGGLKIFLRKFFSLYIGGSGLGVLYIVCIIRVDNLFEKTVFTAVALRAGFWPSHPICGINRLLWHYKQADQFH